MQHIERAWRTRPRGSNLRGFRSVRCDSSQHEDKESMQPVIITCTRRTRCRIVQVRICKLKSRIRCSKCRCHDGGTSNKLALPTLHFRLGSAPSRCVSRLNFSHSRVRIRGRFLLTVALQLQRVTECFERLFVAHVPYDMLSVTDNAMQAMEIHAAGVCLG